MSRGGYSAKPDGQDDDLEVLRHQMRTNRTDFVVGLAPKSPSDKNLEFRLQLEELERILQNLNIDFHIASNPKTASRITRLRSFIERNHELVPYISIVLKGADLQSPAELEQALTEIEGTLREYNNKMHTSERNGSTKLKEMTSMRTVIIDILESEKPSTVQEIATKTRLRFEVSSANRAESISPISTPPESVQRAKAALQNYLPLLDRLIVHLSENPTETMLDKLGYDFSKHELIKKIIERLRK